MCKLQRSPMKTLSLSGFALAALVFTLPALAGDGSYSVSTSAPGAKANAHAAATVSVRPAGAFHVNTEYPVSLSITAPDGVTLDKAKQNKDDAKRFDKDGVDFSVGYTAAAPGKKSFTGTVRFAVCTDTTCNPH